MDPRSFGTPAAESVATADWIPAASVESPAGLTTQTSGQTVEIPPQGEQVRLTSRSQVTSDCTAGRHEVVSPPLGSGGISVIGCENPQVGDLICGTYSPHTQNHGRPVYKKNG